MQGALLEVVQGTDPGRDPNKQVNEDAAGHHATALGHLLVVCDGMGGHALGQEASQLALTTIVQRVAEAPPGTSPGAALAGAVAQAGRLVYQMGGVGPNAGRPGSTCVAMLVHPAGAEIAHVGDSRAYLVRQGQIWQLTKDHSVVQQMVDRGALTPEQAAAHPEANKITRALGMRPETEVELRDPPLAQLQDDVLVLASDGLCDLVRTDEIGAVIIRGPTLEQACAELIRLANERGGHDNITVQIARVLASAMARATPPATVPIPAPTLVETRAPLMVEKTLVDPAPVLLGTATPPGVPQMLGGTVPNVVAVGPYGRGVATGPSAGLPPAPGAPLHGAPPYGGVRTDPGSPSRRGWVFLLLGFALVALILMAVVLWWILRAPR